MSTFKKSTITLAGKPRDVLLINYNNDDTTVESKTIDRMHHIHILDRSYSMSGNIVGLMEDVKKTFRAIPVGDYISVVWFSSEGQNGVVIKGYKKTENDDFADVDRLIDSIKHCVGCTCFHEPMDLVKSIIDEMKPLCPYYNVTLFTDGCSCCNVPSSTDYNMTYSVAKTFSEDIMALNTLGYGYYYDKEFLTKLAEISDFGKYIHSSNVKEYSQIFTHNYERVKDMVAEKVELEMPNCEILYLNSKSTKMETGAMNLSSIEKRKNQFLVILPEENDKRFNMSLNGEFIDYTKMKSGKILDSTVLNLQYAYAYENYYKGNREVCLDVLKDIKDKYFIDEQLNAFTVDETSKFMKVLNKAIFNNKTRMKNGEAPDNYIPADDAFCIMDLLKILSEEGNFYVPDFSSYKRIGLQVVDTFNLFTPKRDYEILAPFNDNLVFNKSKLNISVRFLRDGTVNINPKSAKRVDLPEVVDSKQFQSHTIIKDGHLNMDKITVKITKEAYGKIVNTELNEGITILKNIDRNDEAIYEIDLTTLPVINRQYLNESSIDRVLELVKENTELEMAQKVLNYLIAKNPIKDYVVESSTGLPVYTDEQVEVLKEHGLNDHLTYVGVNRKTTEKNENDYYEARELEFQLKGCSSIPAIEKALADYDKAISKSKEPNFMPKYIHNYIIAIYDTRLIKGITCDSKEEKQMLTDMLKDVKNKLINNRIELNTIKIAKVLTSSWWEGLTLDKDKYTYTVDNDTVIIKTSYEKVYFS